MLRPVAIVLAASALAACSKSNVSTAPSGSASSAATPQPAWLAFAARAPIYGEQARKERTGTRVKPAALARIDALFDRMTEEPATARGLASAAKTLEDGRPLASDPTWAGSGTSPGSALLHHGGMALLVELTQRACAANAGNKDIGRAADTVPLPPVFNSGGRDANAAERDRHVLQEAARACGSSAGP